MIIWISHPKLETPIVANIVFKGTLDCDLEKGTIIERTEEVEVKDVAISNEYLEQVTRLINPFIVDGMHINELNAKLKSSFNMTKQCRSNIIPHIIEKLNMKLDKKRLFFKDVPCEA